MISEEKIKDEEKRCPECGSIHLSQDYQRGELICERCGLVIDKQYIDDGPEWRSFDMQEEAKRARTGPPTTEMIHDKGLSTSIDYSNRDSYGKKLSQKNRSQAYRLRKWQRRVRITDAVARNLSQAIRELNRLSSRMDIPKSIRENASMIYRKAVDKNLIRGRSIDCVVASTLYAACRKASVPRTLDEIAKISSYDREEIGRTYRFISMKLGLKIKPTKPQEYLGRFCSELKLNPKIQKRAKNIIDSIEKKGLISGKAPTSIAASAIYIASIKGEDRRTQKEIGKVAGVTEVTIRNRYQWIVEELDIGIEV